MDRLKDAFTRLVLWVVRELPYLRTYPSKVAGQTAAGFEVLPDHGSIRGRGASAVPPLYGLPGFACQIPSGARVELGFGGSPETPRLVGYGPDVTEVAFDGGTQAISRVGDSVDAGELYAVTANVAGVDVITQLWYTPPGSPRVWALVTAVLGVPPTPATPGTGVSAVITSGNGKLLA